MITIGNITLNILGIYHLPYPISQKNHQVYVFG